MDMYTAEPELINERHPQEISSLI